MQETEAADRALGLADEAFARLDIDGVVAHLSAALRACTADGDHGRAAMVCARLGDVFTNAMGNRVAGRAWFARARRLVADLEPCIEQGWVAVAAMGCDVDDPDELLASAELALDRARRFGDVNLETKALADGGLAHVQAGRIAQGMDQLDEAMALACGPVDDLEVATKSACSFFTACYFAADFDRAGTWAATFRAHGLISAEPIEPLFLSTHCDSLQATLLMELGRWGEAEAILERSRRAFLEAVGAPGWHPDIALADLRIRQGRLTDAEVLLVGRDQAMEALLPAARLHLARGEHDLARAAAGRGLRAAGPDRLRTIELLAVLLDAELGRGDLQAAADAGGRLVERVGAVEVPALRARAASAGARLAVALGDPAAAVTVLEDALDGLDAARAPWRRATLLLELARVRLAAGDRAGATVDVRAAGSLLAGLDVVIGPEDRVLLADLVRRSTPRSGPADQAGPTASPPNTEASLRRDGRWWVATAGDTTVRLRATKGLHYVADLVARPGVERHVLDLVDRVEGVAAAGGPDRRALGDAGDELDAQARAAYRLRIEALRGDAEDALAAHDLDGAEAAQAELDRLVAELARAFGLGGRSRKAASAAERARLNVTRAIRSATRTLDDALPGAGAALDRRTSTGLYCRYAPDDDDGIVWIVQS